MSERPIPLGQTHEKTSQGRGSIWGQIYMPEPIDARILTHVADLNDLRDERGKDHLLLDIVAISICAVICGAES